MKEVAIYSSVPMVIPNKRGSRKKQDDENLLPHKELESYVNRLTALHIEKQEVTAQIKDVAEQAQGAGFSKKALLALVKRNMETAEQRAERIAVEEEIDRMSVALGMLVDTPLGSAAMRNGNGTEAHA